MERISEDRVAERSYRIWEQEGRPDGRHLDHWFRARAELEAEAGLTEPPSQRRKPATKGRETAGQSEQFLRMLQAEQRP